MANEIIYYDENTRGYHAPIEYRIDHLVTIVLLGTVILPVW